jgi:PKD repeat protein
MEAAEELEVFAGQDKVVKKGMSLDLNDAQVIKPVPPDPERTYTFRWDFDDQLDVDLDGVRDNDGESHERFAEWRYHRTGVYVVTLTVADGIHVAKDTLTVTVMENYPPRLLVHGDHLACMGVPTRLNVTAIDVDDGAEELVWEWDTGDGGRSGDAGPITYTYEEMGTFTVRVVVEDPSGNDAWANFNVTVIDGTRPVCDAGPHVAIMVNETVRFNGTGSHDIVGVTSWRWTFEYNGGAVVLTGPEPEFTFRTAGTYIVGLKVADDAGNEDTDTMTVLVRTEEGHLPEGPEALDHHVSQTGWRAMILTLLIVVCIGASVALNYLGMVYVSPRRDGEIFFRPKGR